MTRVLHVTQVYAGGISRAITSIVDLAPEDEHHLIWAGNELPDDAVRYASVHEMPQSPRQIIRAIQRVRMVVRVVRPDVVHAHSSFGGVYARLARLSVPVMYEPHGYKFDDRLQSDAKRWFFRIAERALARRSAGTVVLSPHEERLARSLDPEARTHFLPNVATIRPSPEYPSTKFEAARSVLMIGRLSQQKGPDFYAEIARGVRAKAPDVEFRWAGDIDGVDDGTGKKIRATLESAGVTILGWLNGDDLAAELARPSLYFHTAHYEGFPLSVLDAAAFEHPVAVRSIPTFEEFDLPSVETPAQGIDLVLDMLDGAEARDASVAAVRRLNSVMNPGAQRAALRNLYDSAQKERI